MNFYIKLKSSKGFTLIELLVVIAIIGLLSSIVLASLNTARAKARDAERKSDMKQISNALELYYNTYQTYTIPTTGWSNGGGVGACGCGWFNYLDGTNYWKSIAQGLVEAGFFSKAPRDPLLTTDNQTPQYMMYPCVNGYFVYAKLENPSAADIATYTNSKNLGCANVDQYGMNYAVGHQ